jgi:phosphocarrier protein
MIQSEVTILNKLGLHARAAAKFVTLASRFDSEIRVQRGAKEANGKSIMGIMMLAASQGTRLCIIASGPDEEKALQQLEALINERFGEHE